ncbi:aspartyl protease family protein [Sphingomonas japonica]|uniref:Aspartyl protease n=1 Tax=Sphingomonas japonica TaxID=511662 RepID=A0ABX0U033_9SPHN|nr:aspartyl protease family protein [Sphingomonas japonica]NIJ23848.1 hypothetical protein [Sphingomonas japonica]
MRFLWLALSMLLPAAAQAPMDPRGVSLARDAEARWIAFDLTPGNQIRFAMQVDGKPATAILDTGVSFSVASRQFARSAALPHADAPGRAAAIGGAVPIRWATVNSLTLGGLERTGGRLAVVDLAPIATGSAAGVDILVGSDILSCCALDIDYDTRRFRLLPSGRMPFTGTSVPLRIGATTQVYISEVVIAGRRIAPLIVDTGDGSAITLSHAAWQRSGARPSRMTSAIAFGIGGAIETDVTILPRLGLGTRIEPNVELRIEGPGGFSERTRTAGRIGSGLLQRYRVLLDPRAGHMILAAGRQAGAMPVRSTSGLLIGHDRGRLRVLHVMRGGPAALAGWKTGELICTVDGATVPPDAEGAVDTRWSAGSPGRTVALGMCDGGERELTLREFY